METQRFLKHFGLFCMIACSLVIAGELQLFVIFPDGSKRAIDIDNSAKVIDLARQSLAECQQQGQFLDASAEHAIITFQGQPLDLNADLSETGICQEVSVEFQLPTVIPIQVQAIDGNSESTFEVDIPLGSTDVLQRVITAYRESVSSVDHYTSFRIGIVPVSGAFGLRHHEDRLQEAGLPCDLAAKHGSGLSEIRLDFGQPCVELVSQQWLLEHPEHRYHREIQTNHNVLEKIGDFVQDHEGSFIYQVRSGGIVEFGQLYKMGRLDPDEYDAILLLDQSQPFDVDRDRMGVLGLTVPVNHTLIFSGVGRQRERVANTSVLTDAARRDW